MSSGTGSISESSTSSTTAAADHQARKEQRRMLKRLFLSEPEILFQEVKFIKKLNDNPSGEVWYGRCRDTDVAVRKVKWGGDPTKIEELKREVETLRKISSPNIALFLGAGVHRESLYIYSEYAADSLRTYLRGRGSRATIVERLNLLYEAALGMFWLHSAKDTRTGAAGLVHRHVKTSCFLVFDHGRTKVCDFGLSTFWAGDSAYKSVWTAPEVRERRAPFSFASDVYSFGLVMAEALTGIEPAFTTDSSTAAAVVAAAVVPPEAAPQTVRDLVARCLSEDPNKRPSFQTIVAELEKSISMLLIPAEEPAKWWNAEFNSKEEVDWKEFEGKYKHVGDTQRELCCLRYFLVPNLASNKVTRTRFGDFIARVCDGKSDWKRLTKIAESFVDKIWFHGYLSINEAVSIAANSKPGSFLVRFSSSFGGFSITYLLADGSIKHTKVMHTSGRYYYGNSTYKNLDKLIKENSDKFALPLYSQSLRSIVNGMDTIPDSYTSHLQTATPSFR